ncbi:hypothetical protein COCCADRAFT_98066, partial [Bipolaris zeicola 26-R-13]
IVPPIQAALSQPQKRLILLLLVKARSISVCLASCHAAAGGSILASVSFGTWQAAHRTPSF